MAIIGIDLGGTHIAIGLVQDGEIIRSKIVPGISSIQDCSQSLDHFAQAIEDFGLSSVDGIGVGAPSVVDVKTGTVYDTANIPAWKEVPLKAFLEKRFGIPAAINNDANCFALGQQRWGVAKDYDNVIGVTLGTGLGVGIIANGQLFCGANTGAGELGCFGYKGKNFEYFCSSKILSDKYHTNGYELFRKAEEGQTEAMEVWKEFGYNLGEFVKLLMLAYDPQAIVFGGGLAGSFKWFGDSLKENASGFVYSQSYKNLKLLLSDNPLAGVLGAAALIKDKN